MSATDILSLALSHVRSLHAYTPGLQPSESGWVKLNTNENPYPPSPRVAEAIRGEIENLGEKLRLYPNPTSLPLRRAIAAHHGLMETQVCVGNGSDDILNLLVRCFCDAQNTAAFPLPSYSLYPVLLEIQPSRTDAIPFDRSMSLPMRQIASSSAKILFLTSPNAPTGVGFSNVQIEGILKSFAGIVVVDEAYAPFAKENAVSLLARYPRLCVTRTFSKAYALAGIRVGYALGHPDLIGLLDRVRDSYNVSRLSQTAALAALQDDAYLQSTLLKITTTRDRCVKNWSERNWFTYPSQANFIFTEPKNSEGRRGPSVAKSAYDYLYSKKVLVRYFPSHALTASFLRVSVGTDDEMSVLNEHLDAWARIA